MLPLFYQTHLQKYLTASQLLTLNLLVVLLQTYKQVRIERLAATLPIPIKQNSRRRHLQRFLTSNRLSVVLLWFPIIKEIVKLNIAILILMRYSNSNEQTSYEYCPELHLASH
jgi:hypothetical protein